MWVDGADDSTRKCELFDIVGGEDDPSTTEYDMCAGRGTCDYASGLCYCQEGFSGEACTDTAYEVFTSNALPAFSVVASGADYTGNVLEVMNIWRQFFKLANNKFSEIHSPLI
jgi:hypothetical protein